MVTQKPLAYVYAIFFSLIVFLALNSSERTAPNIQPDWTVAVYMEAGTPDMVYWVKKNLDDMALANHDSKKLNIVTHVHLEKSEACRYVVHHGVIEPKGCVNIGPDCGQNIVDFMKWTVQNYPAKHYALFAWGHGFGILDPTYRPQMDDLFTWDVDPDEPGHDCSSGVCPLRGFLFNDAFTFVDNAKMIETLQSIKETVLGGNKLDILGTDCCKMAMLEVAYQIKDYANFLVGSQNCELKDGWNYKDLFSSFNVKPLDALGVVQAIVKTYGTYYEKNTIHGTYTLSALDLSNLNPLVDNLNSIVSLCKKLMSKNELAFKAAVFNARLHTPSMCNASYYLDLGEVYSNLLEELDKTEAKALDVEVVSAIKTLLAQGQNFIKTVVAANVTGSAVKKLHGISIYFPRNKIDKSYLNTPFGRETTWASFLHDIIN